MNSLRKWLYKPKRDDKSLLAQFFYADEELNIVAAELDSFDGRKDPERCTSLVNHLRQCQDKVLNICNMIMDEVICGERANRDFRVKFPDDVLQENLAGQLWFGAECLAAGSSIMNREVESASMRPLAKALTKSLENVRNLLRDQCFKNPPEFTEKIRESLKIFDRLFAEFELSYVSAMVPVKTMKEYDIQQSVIVLFSETLQRALKMELLTQEMVDDYDPALMFTIPRLAIVCGLLIYPDGPLSVDQDSIEMSEMFRPFRNLLFKIRELLWTLSKTELYALEKALCSMEEPKDYKKPGGGGGHHHHHHHHHHSSREDQNSSSSSMLENYPIPDLDDFVDKFYSDYPSCKQFIRDFYPATFPCGVVVPGRQGEGGEHDASPSVQNGDSVYEEEDDERTPTVELVDYSFSSDTDSADSREMGRQHRSESETHEEILAERAMMAVQESLVSVLASSRRGLMTHRSTSSSPLSRRHQVQYLRSISCSCGTTTTTTTTQSDITVPSPPTPTPFSSQNGDQESDVVTVNDSMSGRTERSCDVCRRFQTFNTRSFSDDSVVDSYGANVPSCEGATEKQHGSRPSAGTHHREDINQNTQGAEIFGSPRVHKEELSVPLEVPTSQATLDQDNSSLSSACSSCRSMSTAASEDCHSECSSSDTSSYNSECQDDEEIALAMQAAEIATRNEARSKFKSSEDLIHRLFVCVSGVADQLQTNYASDLRNILKCVFAINATPGPEVPPTSSPQPSEGDSLLQQLDTEDRSSESPTGSVDHAEDVLSPVTEQDGVEQPPPWVPDELAPHCMGCRAHFTMVRRRHHCRNCGKVFCARCSSNSVSLPHYGHLKPVRVCNRCFMYQVTPFTIEQTARS